MPLIGWLQGLLALSSVLGGIFGGRGGGNAPSAAVGSQLPKQLMDELRDSLSVDRTTSLRNMLLTDPEVAQAMDSNTLARLGITPGQLEALASGGVPLRRAANNLSFGLLPRWARSGDAQAALLAASPQTRAGIDGTVGPFDNSVDTAVPSGDTSMEDLRADLCRASGGTPMMDNGRYVGCDRRPESLPGGIPPAGGPSTQP